jgi:hypothetical protein
MVSPFGLAGSTGRTAALLTGGCGLAACCGAGDWIVNPFGLLFAGALGCTAALTGGFR